VARNELTLIIPSKTSKTAHFVSVHLSTHLVHQSASPTFTSFHGTSPIVPLEDDQVKLLYFGFAYHLE
jgi:hypothetical protein